MSEGIIQPDGSVQFPSLKLEGFSCEVQHSVNSGRPMTDEDGTVDVGVMVMPGGQPRVILQIQHPDGTSMAASLLKAEVMMLNACVADAEARATSVARSATKAPRH